MHVRTVSVFGPVVHSEVRIHTALSLHSFDSVNKDHSPLQGTLSLFMIISLLSRSRYI